MGYRTNENGKWRSPPDTIFRRDNNLMGAFRRRDNDRRTNIPAYQPNYQNHIFRPRRSEIFSEPDETIKISKSWNEGMRNNTLLKKIKFSSSPDFIGYSNNFRKFDPITKCKSAGIIPYAIHNNQVYFLFQKSDNPLRRKDDGWNDFGGKQTNLYETTSMTAAREFSEETSCLFYLVEKSDAESVANYKRLMHNKNLSYDPEDIEILKKIIPQSQNFFSNRITQFVSPIYLSSKETYISYFIKVEYISAEDIPKAEDLHIDYEDRYVRTCKWFTFDELMALDEKDFHKRLQITKIQQRIANYNEKGLFI